ncbi:gluconokinase [Proteobacteria bacterium 005FR1]|nr:gluconokinase [Proteobacteria bacterium 005FR1]
MGVSGSGKTTVGRGLAEALGWRFIEGDDLHPQANVEKMARSIPLEDEDRQPWLQAIRGTIDELIEAGESAVISCSALKQSYRNFLVAGRDEVTFIYLKGSFDLMRERLAKRKGHYMPLNLLSSQFEALQEPEDAVVVDVDQSPAAIIEEVRRALRSR